MKNVLRYIGILLTFMLILISIFSCNSFTPKTDSNSSEIVVEPPKISTKPAEAKIFAFIVPTLDDIWYQRMVEGFQMAAKEVGANIFIYNSDNDTDKEIENINSAIKQKVNGICMLSFNDNGALLCVKKCNESGIPVVVCDSFGEIINKGLNLVACVDFDWAEIGKIYAEYMAKSYPDENYIIISDKSDNPSEVKLIDNLQVYSEKFNKNKLLAIRYTSNNSESASEIVNNLIDMGLNFKVIFVLHEDMSTTICSSLSQAGILNNPIKVVSSNNPQGYDMVNNGDVSYTVSNSPGWEGYIAFRELWSNTQGKLKDKNRQIKTPVIGIDKVIAKTEDKAKLVPWEPDPMFFILTKQYFPDIMEN